jgi:succinate dehydrogenase / fumarate reductase membrane anchor subunit
VGWWVVRASTVHIWQYITAALLIILLGFHLAERVPGLSPLNVESYEESLSYEAVRKAYRDYWWLLALLLVTALFHGLNGVRGIILEWKPTLHRAVNILFVIVFIALLAYGLRTIALHLAGGGTGG